MSNPSQQTVEELCTIYGGTNAAADATGISRVTIGRIRSGKIQAGKSLEKWLTKQLEYIRGFQR